MRFISKRLGLILWAIVAIAILVVPTWRWRASQQLEGPSLRFPNYSWDNGRDFGLSKYREREAARRFPDDPAAQMAPVNRPSFDDITIAMGGDPVNDPQVIKTWEDYFARYHELESRFPRDAPTRAQHIVNVMSGGLDIDEGLQNDPVEKSQDVRVSDAVINEMKFALRAAQQGAIIEPENAFFPWMEAAAHFSMKRDDLAIAALKRAGECAYFDEHLKSVRRGRLEVLGKMRATGWEDDDVELSKFFLLHFRPVQLSARALIGRARLARTRGDEKRALQLAGVLQNAGAAMARAEQTLLTRRYGERICTMAWKFAIENQDDIIAAPPKYPFVSSLASSKKDYAANIDYQQRVARLFIGYAKENKRPDLARDAQNIVAQFDVQSLLRAYEHPSIFQNLFDSEKLLAKAFWLGGIALTCGLPASLIWLIAWPFSRRSEDANARRQSLMLAMFLAGITIVAVAAILIFASETLTDVWNDENSRYIPPPPSMAAQFTTSIELLCIVPLCIAMLWRSLQLLRAGRWRADDTGKIRWERIVAFLLSGGFFLGAIGSACVINQPMSPVYNVIFTVSIVLFLSCSLIGGALFLVSSRGKWRPFAVSSTCSLWMGIAALMQNTGAGDGLFYAQILWTLAAFLGALALFFLVRNKLVPLSAKDFLRDFAARTRIAAGVLALLCALTYAGVTLWSAPVEARTRAMLARQLQIGEVPWLREQMEMRGS